MRVPISWLRDYVDINMPIELLAERLTLAGFEVGSLEYIGVPQSIPEGIRMPTSDHLVWDREKILLGAIREVKQHPEADRLVLAMVDYGGDELEQCVTGAPNLFDYVGQGELNPPLWTAFAMEGATVWDGHSDEQKLMTLKGKKLRGIYNKSMVCSEKELGISEEHEGIILMDDNPDYVAGTPFQDVLGDVVLDIELTPNLGHGFSVLGVAREVAALTNQELRQPSYEMVAEGESIVGQAAVDIQEPTLNPRFTITLLKDTTVQASPYWLQLRLKLVGQRPINNIVDVTNYITFEIGQPLHAYDYDKLLARSGGKAPTLITALAEGTSIETLDEVKRTVGANQIMVMDNEGSLGFGGIMGGADTEISDDTKNVLLEAAAWNFINIRKTQQAQKVFTEAGTRFSRNVHPSRAILGNTRGIELMRQTGGGTIAEGVIDEYPLKPEPVEVRLPISEVHRLLGMDINIQEALDVLSRLQFDVTLDSDAIHAVTPDYRTDISAGIVGQADLVEEIACIIGYDTIPTTIMADEMPEQRRNRTLEIEEHIRDLLMTLGLTENISYRFTTPEAEAQLVPNGSDSSLPQADYVELANPIASDKTVLRHTLLRNLLESAARNARYNQIQQVFELGSVYLKNGAGLPDEPKRIGLLLTGLRQESDWTGAATEAVDFYDIKGVIEGLLAGLHISDYAITRSDHTTFHPGRSAALEIKGKPIGNFGELHPRVAQALDLTHYPVLIAEVDLDAIIEATPDLHAVTALPTAPPVLEDLALVVAENVPAADVEAVIRKAGGKLLRDVTLFDVYRGDSIEVGHKSLAYALTYQGDETLSDKKVKKVRKSIIFLTEKEVGAKLRS
ncbi:MAG: phenylalanine--tRNA ligase subunit beta [Anaerolineae bacterium]|nr:phenylalanine--tRNA ligase subunit beta [Anaerolineae bacterium]